MLKHALSLIIPLTRDDHLIFCPSLCCHVCLRDFFVIAMISDRHQQKPRSKACAWGSEAGDQNYACNDHSGSSTPQDLRRSCRSVQERDVILQRQWPVTYVMTKALGSSDGSWVATRPPKYAGRSRSTSRCLEHELARSPQHKAVRLGCGLQLGRCQ